MNEFKFNENDFNSRYRAARNKNCPVDLLVMLADDKEYVIRYAVAKNPNCPFDLREKIELDEENCQARIRSARSAHCSTGKLAKLSEEEDVRVRCAVAGNPRSPTEVLTKLARDEVYEVRRAVANNENCPKEILGVLARDKPDIRYHVAKNQNCPEEILAKLAGDRNRDVRIAVAYNPSCPLPLLERLSRNKSVDIREPVAGNPNCSAGLLAKLASDVAVSVRINVADNLACPVEVLGKLARDEHCHVRYAVADNSNCTTELREIALMAGHEHLVVPPSVIQLNRLPRQLEPLRRRIESTVKPFVSVQQDKSIDRFYWNKLRLWESKVGGLPYFTKDHEYPTDPDGKPLLLLVQINFADVPKLDAYPEKGILQIYLGDAPNYVYGKNYSDGTDQSYFRVLYFPEIIYDKDALITDFKFLPGYRSMPCGGPCAAVPVKFELGYEPISVDDYRFKQAILGGDKDENYAINEAYRKKFDGCGSKIGGYPGFIQRDPRGFARLDSKMVEVDAEEFELLLQLDSDFDNVMWGDCGIGNFFIRKADLLKRDFSRVLYDWSCY